MYIDVKLPFFLRTAPKIFNAVADALEWCIASEGAEVIYYYSTAQIQLHVRVE